MKKIAVLVAAIMVFSMVSLPVFAGETIYMTTSDGNYFEEGGWKTTTNSLIKGYNDAPSRYLSSEGSAFWIPEFEQGEYKLYVYKTVHQNSLSEQTFEIVHRGKIDYAVVDFTTGTAGWVELGIYDFWGDGDDKIAVYRENGINSSKATRLSAISFELVKKIDDPIPEPKPEIQGGSTSKPQKSEEEIVSDEVVEPVNPGDVMVIPASNEYFAELKGNWTHTGVTGHNGNGSYYAGGSGAYAKYIPFMPAGKYKVEYFKPVNANSLDSQEITVNYKDKSETFEFDFTTGIADWVTLGEFDFWGNGLESVITEKKFDGQIPIRTSGVRFTLLELSDEPVPEGVTKPVSTKMDIPAYPVSYDGISVVLDGVLLRFDQPSVIVDGRTLVPLRGIFENLGATVLWDGESSTVTATKDETEISLQIGNQIAEKNGSKITLDVPAQLINSRTLVPVRFVSEALGCTVSWNEENRAVIIDTDEKGAENIFIPTDCFDEYGTWKIGKTYGAFGNCTIVGIEQEDIEAKPAKVKINIKEDGEYLLFVHAKDFATNQPGARFFEIELNGTRIPKAFGKHGREGFAWEKVGPLNLKEGVLELALVDTSRFYARCDGIFITKDIKMKNPPEDYAEITEIAEIPNSAYDDRVYTPKWAVTDGEYSKVDTISSDKVSMSFYTVNTTNGTVIQKETTIEGRKTTGRDNLLSALLMYTTKGSYAGSSGQFPIYEVAVSEVGVEKTILQSNIFKMGEPSWLIPDKIEIINESTAKLTASNDYADADFVVELKPGETEPEITFTLYPKKEGQFTANIITNKESEEFSYAFLPFRFNGTVLPSDSYIVAESHATAPVSLKTCKAENGEPLTIGIAVSPESVPVRWAKISNSEYGLSLKGVGGGAQPVLMAPLYSSENSKMKAGDSYSIKFRIVESYSEWYPVYEKLVLNLYGLEDYRSNYVSSLTDAIFNTQNLANSDKAGWDENELGYYNIEAENLVTQSNPLVFMSTYLLSEDKAFLERRTVPTIAYLFTRPVYHYNNGDIDGDAIYGGVTEIGNVCTYYGNAVYGGGHVMSQGLIPQFKEHGIDKGILNTNTLSSLSPAHQAYAWLYKFTGNEEYLKLAKEEADKYIAAKIEAPRSERFNEEQFIALDFYPQFAGLLDLYEISGDKKYLDAAEKAARNLLPTVWIYPNDADGAEYTTDAEYIKNNHFSKGYASWYGKEKYRAGYENIDKLENQTYPFWVASRAGLSLEQTYTFTMHESGNMIMTNWAPELMRLAEYTGDEIFEIYARNAVIGRHSTYTGYYYNNYFTYQQDPDYATEGPDITGLYWHHIQPFLAMLQDFLFTQAWNWSDKKIDFPSLRNTGYAYFSNRMYGGESGTFYDIDNMWLWLKEGLLKTDNVQIDWIGARKDGIAAFCLMNESKEQQSTVFTLGEELAEFNGIATMYDKDGNKTKFEILNGGAQITVPAHSLVSFVVESDNVTAPGYSKVTINSKNTGKQTVRPSGGETDGGQLYQMSDDEYFAHVYTSDSIGSIDGVTLNYKIGNGEWKKLSDNYAPFEFIIKVDNTNLEFSYYFEKHKDGNVEKMSVKTLVPITKE